MKDAPILVLGCERSGSTWLFNILDSSTSTICFMEPFADYASLFPGFPHRFHYLEEVTLEQKEWVQERIRQLYRSKFPFFYRPGHSLFIKKIDHRYVQVLKRLSGIAGFGVLKKIEQYELLNLTKIDFRKASSHGVNRMVIKELRLNFKLRLVAALFPGAKIVVAVRSPVLQIESILKKFERNGLHELKRSLLFLKSQLYGNPRFIKYQSGISDFDGLDIVEKLAFYWVVSYNTLVEDLKQLGLTYVIANNDVISLDPEKEIKKILDFCEFEIDDQTDEYLMNSTNLNLNVENAISTRRKSREYYLEKVREIDTSLQNNVLSFIRNEYLVDELQPLLRFKIF